jgi:hypothetical protein
MRQQVEGKGIVDCFLLGWLASYQPLKQGHHASDNNALTLFVVSYRFVECKTPLHRVASTAKEKGAEVRFRGVVSARRYMKDDAEGRASCPVFRVWHYDFYNTSF